MAKDPKEESEEAAKDARIQLKKLSLKQGDVLLFRGPPFPSRELMEHIAEDLKKSGVKGITLLVLPRSTPVELISEDDMHQLGWVRRKPSLLVKPQYRTSRGSA